MTTSTMPVIVNGKSESRAIVGEVIFCLGPREEKFVLPQINTGERVQFMAGSAVPFIKAP